MNHPSSSSHSRIDESALRKEMAAFQRPSVGRSLWQITNSLIPYLVLWVLAYQLMKYSYWLVLPVTVLAAGFLIRLFIIFHDCGHSAFFKAKWANDTVGIITGILTYTPYHYWRANHARHHATSGNLDKRGQGDVWMMTVEEYVKAPLGTRVRYRLYRNPFVMFLLGPLLLILVTHRFVQGKANRIERLSVYGTNVAILGLGVAMGLAIGIKAFLLIQMPILFIALMAGVWLFYVQHQFEGVYWTRQKQWDFITASIEGGSFYALPAVLRWFTGNIGYHHVHHVNPRIPNYHLPKCHDQIDAFKKASTVRFWSSFKSLSYRLWDERQNRLVGFNVARKYRVESAGAE